MYVFIDKRTRHVGVFLKCTDQDVRDRTNLVEYSGLKKGDYILIDGNEEVHHFFYTKDDIDSRYTLLGKIDLVL